MRSRFASRLTVLARIESQLPEKLPVLRQDADVATGYEHDHPRPAQLVAHPTR